jgi:hydroxyacylglutathione hydrolase
MLTVSPVPAFQDNYLWLIHDGQHAAVVDPGDAGPIFAALDANQFSLGAILLTHHHADHVGGVRALVQHARVPVFGPGNEGIAEVTHPLQDGDSIKVPGIDLVLDVLAVPGHTRGHIAYVAPSQHWLFCGDTLFAGGCGRLFEGTPAQMHASLSKLAGLPEHTAVYCAHEYTLSHLKFAREVEPENMDLLIRIEAEQHKRANNFPTVPSTIGLEKRTNPFLRASEPAIADRLMSLGHLTSREPVAVFAALRHWKNSWR